MYLIRARLRPVLLSLVVAALVAGAATLPSALGTAADGATRPATTTSAKAVTGSRPFKPTSYWNTKLGNAPKSTHNRAWINDSLNKSHTQNYLRLVLGDFSMPVYRSKASDPLYRIHATGHTVRVHIPARARPMTGNDGALTVIDRATGQVVGLGGAKRTSDGWTAAGMSRYMFSSNGIVRGLPGGSRKNFGHRGIPASVTAVTKREILKGRIRHRLEVYWWETASRTPAGRSAYFPMNGSESGKTGVVPEGAVIRIKRSVNLDAIKLSPAARVIARALQQYGAVVGDNSGSGNNLKLQANTNWSGILNADSLRHIPWTDYVFVKGGYRP